MAMGGDAVAADGVNGWVLVVELGRMSCRSGGLCILSIKRGGRMSVYGRYETYLEPVILLHWMEAQFQRDVVLESTAERSVGHRFCGCDGPI